MTITRYTALLAICAWLIPAVWLIGHAYDQVIADGRQITRIEEDSPLWDCRTMGNHICGKETP